MAKRNFIPLNGPIMPQHQDPSFNPPVDPADVVTIKTGLSKMGLYPSEGIDDLPDPQLFKGISLYQGEQRLPQNGVIAPGDATHNRMANSLTSSLFYDPPKNWYPNWLDQTGRQSGTTSYSARSTNLRRRAETTESTRRTLSANTRH